MHDIRPILPEVFEEPGTLLYIGARPDACAWLTELADAGNEITLLEVWPDNILGFKGDGRIAHFIQGDVTKVDLHDYDYIWWWHGPEHVEKGHAQWLLLFFPLIAKRLLAVAAPWGLYMQGAHGGNLHENHQWSVYEQDLWGFGFETKTDGAIDQPGSEIVGWIRL